MDLLERLTVDGDHDHVHEGDTTSLNYDHERAYCSSPCDNKSMENHGGWCEISSSHGGEYEAQNLLGCTAVILIEYRPTFQRCVLPHRPDDGCSTPL
jgi:hypothetical protein